MNLRVSQYMTSGVRTIGKTISILVAWKQMTDHKIRHLPVLEAGRLVGVISDRDIRYLVSFQESKNLVVGDVMTPDPYVVPPTADLAEVADEMIKHQIGSAIVQDREGKLVGIFTYEDGIKALAELIRKSSGKKAA